MGIIFSPLEGVGLKQRLAHTLIDAFGSTGVPLPGSTYLRNAIEFIFGQKLDSRWFSRLGGYRHTDLVATGATSGLLLVYNKMCSVQNDSLRKHKMALIAHGTCSASLLMMSPIFLKIAARRSLINHGSLVMMMKTLLEMRKLEKLHTAQAHHYSFATNQIFSELETEYNLPRFS